MARRTAAQVRKGFGLLASQATSGKSSWRATALQFVGFVALFAVYDATILWTDRAAPHGVSLVDYVVRDGRTDESAMYMPEIRELIDGEPASTDPYLKEHCHLPSVRPRLPAMIGYALHRLGGSTNAAVVLLHTVPPAISAILLVRLFMLLLPAAWAFPLALLSVGGVTYEFNYYVNLLRLAELAGPAAYNPELHLVGPYSLHLEFGRYFSPGMTLGLLLVGVLAAARDPDLRRRRTSIIIGAVAGLQLDVYVHAAVVLATLAASLLLVGWIKRCATGESFAQRTTWIGRSFGLMSAASLATGAYWFWRWASFRHLQQASDIVARVGFLDDRVDVNRTPLLVMLLVALVVRRAANRAAGRPPGELLATPRDRFWTAAMIASVVTGWLPGILGNYGLFPDPFLIPLRYLSYLAPALLGYAVAELARAKRPQFEWTATPRKTMLAATAAYAVLLTFGEWSAGRNNSHLYTIPDDVAAARDAILAETPPRSVILTDDLRLAYYLVCETDRYSYVGYGSSSNASTDELVERLMIPSLLAGRSFDAFWREDYQASRGLPWGPTGAHWALHHSGDVSPLPVETLRTMYERLDALTAEELLSRYGVDYIYTTSGPVTAKYARACQSTTAAALVRIVPTTVEHAVVKPERAGTGRLR